MIYHVMHENITMDLHTLNQWEAGCHSPSIWEAGFHSPSIWEAGCHSPSIWEAGFHSPSRIVWASYYSLHSIDSGQPPFPTLFFPFKHTLTSCKTAPSWQNTSSCRMRSAHLWPTTMLTLTTWRQRCREPLTQQKTSAPTYKTSETSTTQT